ncbi:SDR family NAD(P)-dependent oxidoreductase [Alicyclobacillus mengziensis]|uniref:SDR family oxidoreductase n=1 Tax=Alicyclobacillus mengziensis TaxID=2931921 RepID=A0A9X7W2W2_9BACL|nr:SDR family oxidoreductase [Alicyclobacillus mengziensis]QSO49320.1 SDR family oxidoreductase [Alicyclobacillus mengziensis]
MESYDFRNRVLVVTGGASGIGRGICTAFSDAGGTSVCLDVNEELALQVEQAYHGPGQIHSYTLDVRNPERVMETFKKIIKTFGRIDGLVLSAAIQPRVSISQMTDEQWHNVMDVNLNGVFYSCRAVLPHLQTQRYGSIVTFTSGLALQGWASTSAYSASKAALIGFTKSLAREMLPFNVRANVVHPGITDSPLFTDTKTPEELEFFKRNGGAIGSVQDVVQLLMFLLSDLSSSMTGLFINRDLIFPKSQ